MKNTPTFNPYIGKNYESQDFKILVLGESFHFNEEWDMHEEKELCAFVVNRYIAYLKGEENGWPLKYTLFTNVIHGKKLNKSEILDFWEKCCFYNYVQFIVKRPRERPEEWMFKESKDAFEFVIKQTKPNVVFVWGKTLWNNFPFKENYERIQFEGGEIDILKLDYDLPIIIHNHPSSFGFGYRFSEEIMNSIELIKTYWREKYKAN